LKKLPVQDNKQSLHTLIAVDVSSGCFRSLISQRACTTGTLLPGCDSLTIFGNIYKIFLELL